MTWTDDFWRRVAEMEADVPRDPDGKVSVRPGEEDAAVIADDKAFEPLPEEDR